MKTYDITLKHDSGSATHRISAESFDAALTRLCDLEKAPKSALHWWAIVPTARQIRRTQSLLRCI